MKRVLPFEKPLQSEAQTIPGQLALLGLKPRDVNYVINSHYHFDHCGGNKHLTEACTVCHALELEACQCPQPFEKLGYSDLSFDPQIAAAAGGGGNGDNGRNGGNGGDPPLDIYTPKYNTLTGDQEIAKGLWLFETPGHTAGHYSMMVELAGRRPMLFTAVHRPGDLEHATPLRGGQHLGRRDLFFDSNDAGVGEWPGGG